MKLSRYNVIVERQNVKYLWNTLSGALIKIDDDGLDYIRSFNASGDVDNECFELLRSNGCIVNESSDELGRILIEEKIAMLVQESKYVHYTIAVGLDCNYRCLYCFENGKRHQVMSSDMVSEVCKFIIENAKKNRKIEKIGITWFGGEPLLHLDIIEEISRTIMCFCTEHEIEYSAGIYTNGRYLTSENSRLLKELKVKYAQVSVDGLEEHFVKQKGASKDDFEKTIDNIESSASIIPITVRINVDDDMNSALECTKYLLKDRNLDGKIKVYIAHIRDYDCTGCSSDERESHGRFLDNQMKYMKQFGVGKTYKSESFSGITPRRRTTTCLSVCHTNPCIGPDGSLYRCEHHFGDKEYVVGNVKTGIDYSSLDMYYMQFTHRDECKECVYFPICLGGCMNDYRGDDTILDCERLKKQFKNMLFYKIESCEDNVNVGNEGRR